MIGVRNVARAAVVAAMVLVALLTSRASGEVRYTATDLGNLGGLRSFAYGINNAGQVAGWVDVGDGRTYGFVWDNGRLSTLPVWSLAYDINSAGQVVGEAMNPDGMTYQAFLWHAGAMEKLGTLGGGDNSYAYGINDAGQVVGRARVSTRETHAFVWKDNRMTDLGLGWANDINEAGMVVGGDGEGDACAWNDGTLPSGTFPYSSAQAVNEISHVVGMARETAEVWHAVLWKNGALVDLGRSTHAYLFGAYGISDAGQVVGGAGDYNVLDNEAFIWEDGVRTDLRNLVSGSWDALVSARDINDAGQIVGWGVIGGQTHAFLLTPIPEPATLALLAAGLGVLVARRRKA